MERVRGGKGRMEERGKPARNGESSYLKKAAGGPRRGALPKAATLILSRR